MTNRITNLFFVTFVYPFVFFVVKSDASIINAAAPASVSPLQSLLPLNKKLAYFKKQCIFTANIAFAGLRSSQ
jgi:hypothetical protein